MNVALLQVVLQIPDANSLKDKRRIVRGLLDRIRNEHPVAAAEIEDQDVWRSAVVGFAAVSNSAKHAASVLSSVLEYIRRSPACRVVEHELETL
jgi:uncharacterized protein YlxP (DUF503 family)